MCGICHPPPSVLCSLATREEGWYEGGHWCAIERDPAPIAPTKSTTPRRRRSTMVTLTRPRSQQEARAFYAQIAKALDDLGVEHGQDFTLTAATTYTATLMDVAVTHTPDDAITGG